MCEPGDPLTEKEFCADGTLKFVERSTDDTVFCLECFAGKPAKPSMETGCRSTLGVAVRLSLDTDGVSFETYQAALRAIVSSDETSSPSSGETGLTRLFGSAPCAMGEPMLGLLTMLDL